MTYFNQKVSPSSRFSFLKSLMYFISKTYFPVLSTHETTGPAPAASALKAPNVAPEPLSSEICLYQYPLTPTPEIPPSHGKC